MSEFRRALRTLIEANPARGVERAASDRARAESAVLVVVAGSPPHARVLLVRRSKALANHAGEIGFPGGVRESGDASLVATAIRETHEEVALPLAGSDVVGPLDQVFAGDRYVISPFLAWVPKLPQLRAAPEEIDDILTPALAHFLDGARFREEQYVIRGRHIDGYAYLLDEGRVWGATARILHGFLNRAARSGTRLA